MILDSLNITYTEHGYRHVYIAIVGKSVLAKNIEARLISASSMKDCEEQCGGSDNVFTITLLEQGLQELEMKDLLERYSMPDIRGGNNETRLT
jgi:hypothetical protein